MGNLPMITKALTKQKKEKENTKGPKLNTKSPRPKSCLGSTLALTIHITENHPFLHPPLQTPKSFTCSSSSTAKNMSSFEITAASHPASVPPTAMKKFIRANGEIIEVTDLAKISRTPTLLEQVEGLSNTAVTLHHSLLNNLVSSPLGGMCFIKKSPTVTPPSPQREIETTLHDDEGNALIDPFKASRWGLKRAHLNNYHNLVHSTTIPAEILKFANLDNRIVLHEKFEDDWDAL